ncbi:MAG: hypothetical protein ABIV63_16490, partial [Caldimonas sp.]
GDFHNHTTCSDGAISLQKLVKKATGTGDDGWGLDWFVQAGHGNSGGTRNCTLVEDATLSTPAYPFISGTGPSTTWSDSIGAANVKGDPLNGQPYMWRWQSIQEYQYPLLEYLSAYKGLPLFQGIEQNPWGHEHVSMSIITGQIPAALDSASLPTVPGPLTARYSPLGNADALAQHTYCFDRALTDRSRGNATGSTVGNNWDCGNANSPASVDPALGWNPTARKLLPASGTGSGTRGHAVTVEAVKWMGQFHPQGSYYVPAHLERAGPFNPNGNNGFNVEHLRDFNNTAPDVAFGFETQPGHGASSERGEYFPKRNSIGGVLTDSVGGTTYGGTGVYGAQVGGVWDALLGEGRNFWFFASSDWHNRGIFGPDDRRSTQDFQPGEYQRNYTMVRSGKDKIRPQGIVDGLRGGNNWAASGQLIDRLAFVACASYKGGKDKDKDEKDGKDYGKSGRDHDDGKFRPDGLIETIALKAAEDNTDVDEAQCATMGEKLVVRPGAEIVLAVVVRDPQGVNNSPYSFPNPSLMQVGIDQPMNAPVLDHIDLIRGLVSGYKVPGAADYAGQWPANEDWLKADGKTAGLASVPVAAKNTSAAVIKTFGSSGASAWRSVYSHHGKGTYLKMTYRIPAVSASQYVRLRGTNMPPAVPYETDGNGNPLADLHTNATTTVTDAGSTPAKPATPGSLKVPCTTTIGKNLPANGAPYAAGSAPIDACPNHLPAVGGVKYVAYDVAAWADLWFYSNPIYIEVSGSTKVAGVK